MSGVELSGWLYEAKYAIDLLWRIRAGEGVHDDEVERAAHAVMELVKAAEQGEIIGPIDYVALGID